MNGIMKTKEGPQPIRLGKGEAALRIDLSVYSRDAVLRAAYKLSDQLHVQVASEATGSGLRLTLSTKTGALEKQLGSFLDELLDQQVRIDLGQEMGPVRELIVAQAFAEGNLLWPEETRKAVTGGDEP